MITTYSQLDDDFCSYSAESKYCDDSNAKVVGKMKDETSGVAIEKFVGLKPKMYLILASEESVSDSSEYKKSKGSKGVNKNVVAKIILREYKDVLLNKNYLRHSVNRIQSKNQETKTYEINKLSLSCFDDKIHFLDNGIYVLALCY